jgi:hypothetical protein
MEKFEDTRLILTLASQPDGACLAQTQAERTFTISEARLLQAAILLVMLEGLWVGVRRLFQFRIVRWSINWAGLYLVAVLGKHLFLTLTEVRHVQKTETG